MSFAATSGLTVMADDHAPKAGRRDWIGLAPLALACALHSLDQGRRAASRSRRVGEPDGGRLTELSYCSAVAGDRG
jgi:hypothetical protein